MVEATRFANNEAVEHPAFIGYNEWADFKIAANNGDCQEYAPWIRCIEEFGGETLIRFFGKLSREEGAEHVVTTAHRAKGREWPCVRLTNDFRSPELSDDREEGRLLYVAATRAMLRLDYQHNSAIRHYAAISPYTTYVERDEFGFGKISHQTDDKPDDLRDIGKALCRIGELLQGYSKDLGGLSKQVPLDTLPLLDAVREFDNRVINKYVGFSANNLCPNTDINTALTDCNERLTPILKRLDHLPLLTQAFCKNDHFGRIKLAYEAGSINMNGWISIPSNCQGGRITYQFSIPSFRAPNQAARNTVIELRDQTTDRPAGILVIWLPNAYSVVSSHSGFGILIKEFLSDEATAHYRQENLFEKIISLFAPNQNQGQSQLGNTIPLVLNGVVENNKAEDGRDSASQIFSISISQMVSYKELLSGVATSVGMASGLF